jgi:hypothetical protein
MVGNTYFGIRSGLPVIREECGNSRDPNVLNASYVGGIVGSEFILSSCLKASLALRRAERPFSLVVKGGAGDQAEQFMAAKRTLLTALAGHRLTMANEGRAERVM